MPNLLPPRVIAPLSECSKHVRVQNQLTGSTVEILANGVHVGGGIASWSDQVFLLTTPLLPGQHVTARQQLGPDTSPPAPPTEFVEVQKKPAVIGNVGFSSPMYVCGECIHLDGLVPGATVDVKVGGNPAGSGTADDGTVRLHLSIPIIYGQPVTAQQTACGLAGLITNSPPPDLPEGKREGPLPAPVIASPLLECQRSVSISNVLVGATVTVTRTMGASLVSCFDYGNEHFDDIPPLKLGEVLIASQSFPKCQRTSTPSAPIKVGKAVPVPVPKVHGPLCAETTTVEVQNLMAGSQVRLFQNGIIIGLGEASSSTVDFEIPSPGLVSGDLVTAEQELCGKWSLPSNSVKVDPRPLVIAPTHIPGPLFECASVVRVTNIHPGGSIYIYSVALGEIGWQQVFGTWADIHIAPQLTKGDTIYAVEIACGLTSVKSNLVHVLAAPKLNSPVVIGPVEDCMRSVTVGNVVPGARVDVEVNGIWSGSADAGSTSVEVGLIGGLAVGDSVRARQRLCKMITGYGEPQRVLSHVAFTYLTEHFENARTGWNPFETTLTVANVPLLKQLFTLPVDGQVYAQPLYMHHVNIPDLGVHNVLYVATENDSVYAFDADNKSAFLWKRVLLPPGETPLGAGDIEGCDNVAPKIGITSTPVINCGTYTLYVATKTKRVAGGSTTFHHYLHALDIATGDDKPGSPVEISASYPGNGQPNDGHGNVLFSKQWQMNRPGLLLLNGIVYLGFGAHCDYHAGEYHGWVMGFDSITLAHLSTFCTTPDVVPDSNPPGDFGGIWQGGIGLAADPQGFIYCTVGNAPLTANIGGRDYGDAVLKLTKTLAVASWFTPADQPQLLANDIDLGSGGVLILPDRTGPGNHPNILVTLGKDGNIMVLDRANLGGYTGPAANNTFGANPNAVQTLLIRPGIQPGDQAGVWGGPAYYYGGGQGAFLYYCGNGSALTAFSYQNGNLTPAIVGGNPNQGTENFPSDGGTTPVVSSNSEIPGSAVVWAVARRNGPGVVSLWAYDATNLRTKLFAHDVGPWANDHGGAFIEPTVVRGKVYVGSDNQISVFGL
jgi:hypothetical protein